MKYVIASALSEQSKFVIQSFGIEVIEPPENHSVGKYVKHHADLSFLFDGISTVFIAAEMIGLKKRLEMLGLHVIVPAEKLGAHYPQDCPLNCVVTEKYLIGNIDTLSPIVVKYFTEAGKRIIHVKQGYTKCSVIPLRDDALITDDDSIFDACTGIGMDVLKVSKGSVMLPGFDYGFIGGASGVISNNTVVFNGDISTHSDGNEIIDFLNKYGMNAVSLTSGRLCDIGSIIPLYREV